MTNAYDNFLVNAQQQSPIKNARMGFDARGKKSLPPPTGSSQDNQKAN